MFKEERDTCLFSWDDLGNPKLGRPNLGQMVPVLVYRLFQYTMRDVLIAEYDVATANKLFVACGRSAGYHFCENMLDKDMDFNEFIGQLQRVLKELAIGILRVEGVDTASGEVILTVAEDLDCSGLPPSDETICEYDEGFIGGILKSYTGKEYIVKEIDCWTNGDRVCRFKATPLIK